MEHIQRPAGGRWRLAARVLAFGLVVSAAVFVAPVRATPVYYPPTGFFIAPSHDFRNLRSPTGPLANWNIAEWNIPEDLPPFGAAGVSQNRWASVTWLGAGRYQLAQNGAGLPCEIVYPSGRRLVDEFDLLASPNNQNTPHFPQAAAANRQRLSDLTRIEASVTLQVMQAQTVDTACLVTRTIFLFAVVLTNPVQAQVLFYQLRLGYFASQKSQREPEPGWFFTGTNTQQGRAGQFGFGDDISAYGKEWAKVGQPSFCKLNLLPRLVWVLRQGAKFGLDQELSHWRVTGTYAGQAVMGHMKNSAIWSAFALDAS